MGILTALFSGVAAIGALISSENKQQRRIDNYVNERIADGWNRVANPELEKKYYDQLSRLWIRSVFEKNPDLFYPEKKDLFRLYPEAARDWVKSESEEMVIRDGYAPARTAFSFSLRMNGGHEWWRLMGWATKEDEMARQKTT